MESVPVAPLSLALVGEPRIMVECLELALRGMVTREFDILPRARRFGAAPDVIVYVGLTSLVPAGLEVIKRDAPASQLVWLAGHPDGAQVTRALRLGCSCIVSESATPGQVVSAIDHAAAGETWSSPDLLASMAAYIRKPKGGSNTLTEREL